MVSLGNLSKESKKMERQMRSFVDFGDVNALLAEIAKCFEKIKVSDEPRYSTDELLETMNEYYGDISSEVMSGDVNMDSLSNLFFLKNLLESLKDDAYDEDFYIDLIYESDDYKEFVENKIKYFEKNTNFKEKMNELLRDIFYYTYAY